jgi:hypothetical protein
MTVIPLAGLRCLFVDDKVVGLTLLRVNVLGFVYYRGHLARREPQKLFELVYSGFLLSYLLLETSFLLMIQHTWLPSLALGLGFSSRGRACKTFFFFILAEEED